jgi:uncharacterized membrane protein YkvA (DUF1232 family)
MGMKLSFELTDRDLRYFRDALKESRAAVRDADETDIIEAVRQVLDEIQTDKPLPDFVADYIPQLFSLIQMLTDAEWRLPKSDRERLLAMFIYFADPEDILPDDIPVIGYLDDIIILKLVTRDLQHVHEAYMDYCKYRDDFDAQHGKSIDGAIRRDRLDKRCQQLHLRMHRRTAHQRKIGIW